MNSEAKKLKNTAVLQFLKSPEKDPVKTRLWPAIGEKNALELHKKLAGLVASSVEKLPEVDRYLWSSQLGAFAEKLASDFGLYHEQQSRGDLGERLAHAFSCCLTRYEKVIVIGSDCPFIDASYIKEAIRVLDSKDVVVGAAVDGGYVLIGLKADLPFLFSDISWGSEHVLKQTLAKVSGEDKSYGLLPALNDIDVAQDLQLLNDKMFSGMFNGLIEAAGS